MPSLPTNQTENMSNAKYAQENRKYCDTREKRKALYNAVMSVRIRHCNYQLTFLSLPNNYNALFNHLLGLLSDNITYHHIFELPHSACDQQDTCTHRNLLY